MVASTSLCCVAFHCKPMPRIGLLPEIKFLYSTLSVSAVADSWDSDMLLLEKCQKQIKKRRTRTEHLMTDCYSG